MVHFVVKVTELLTRRIIVRAENADDAVKKAEAAYQDGKFYIDLDDYDGFKVETLREATHRELKFYDILEDDE